MDWTDYTLDRRFTGRAQELDLLSRELLAPDPKVVAITGAPGTGKTALAMMFGHMNASAFPAGVYHIHASPFEALANTVAAHVSHPSSPYLLILDNMEARQAHQQYQELSEVRRERPSARIIGIARDQGWFGQADLTLQLKGLNHADLHQLLQKLGFAADAQSRDFDLLEGSPLLAQLIAEYSKRASVSPRQVLERLAAFRYSGLVGLDGRPLVRGTDQEKQIVLDIRSVSDDLLAKAYRDPKLLYEISPRRFEEFVAELLDRLGYEITLTPASKDGGKDIYAAKRDDLGTFLYLVECKRYSPDHKVGVGLIRELNGVVQAERATAGILATTSFFTKGAKEFQERLSHQISLKDYLGLQEWMSRALKQ